MDYGKQSPYEEAPNQDWTLSDTFINTWFERDRAHVELVDKWSTETIIEWWDEEVSEAVEDGFLNPSDWHLSAFEYAKSLGLL